MCIIAVMKLKQLRTQIGLKRRELADQLGKTESCISNYENGYRQIPVNTAMSIIKIASNHDVYLTLNDLYEVKP